MATIANSAVMAGTASGLRRFRVGRFDHVMPWWILYSIPDCPVARLVPEGTAALGGLVSWYGWKGNRARFAG